eukprot:TRINITY_DN1032_c0_g1_i1.p1 TRINITY_DN1032_c0_g1~~TRINITY_DN1032_c0_g1_i1.p1  ORF type:complete len:1091 (-),score=290.04 TRINITY_DN1032_c0_g1_i1:164-3436(-)
MTGAGSGAEATRPTPLALDSEDRTVAAYVRNIIPTSLGLFALLLWVRGYGDVHVFTRGVQAILDSGYTESTLPRLHGAFAASFACALVVDTVGLMHTKTRTTRDLLRLLAFINMLPFIVYLCLSSGIRPDILPVPVGNPPVYAMRYIQWSFSTPSLVLMISRLSGPYRGTRSVPLTMAVDWIMVVTGYLSSVSPMGSVPRYVYLLISCLTWCYVQEALWHFHGTAIENAIHPDDQRILRTLRYVTCLVWTVFPVVWLLEDQRLLHPFFVELGYALADFSAKMVYSMMLRAGTYMSVERLVVMAKDDQYAARRDPSKITEQAAMGMRMVQHSITNSDSGESMRAFLRAMSHELMTPLNAIAAAHQSHMELKSNTAQGVRWTAKEAAQARNRHLPRSGRGTIDAWIADQWSDDKSYASETTVGSQNGTETDMGSVTYDEADQEEMLAASVAVHTLRKTISNALHYSELSSGRKRRVRHDLDLYDALDAALHEVEATSMESRVAVLFSIAKDIPRFIKSDADAIKSIALNIIDNAVKFSSSGSAVTVRIELDSSRLMGNDLDLGGKDTRSDSESSSGDSDDDVNNEGTSTSTASTKTGKNGAAAGAAGGKRSRKRRTVHIRMVVVDNGPGMSSEQVAKALEPFTQLDSDLAGRTGGVGIGLTLAQEYVKLLRGELRINSEPGEGTVVDVTLPVARSRSRSAAVTYAPTWTRPSLTNVPVYLEGPFPRNPHIKDFVERVCRQVGVQLVSRRADAQGVLCSHYGTFAAKLSADALEQLGAGAGKGSVDDDKPTITMDLPVVGASSDIGQVPPVPLTATRVRDALEYLGTQIPSYGVALAPTATPPTHRPARARDDCDVAGEGASAGSKAERIKAEVKSKPSPNLEESPSTAPVPRRAMQQASAQSGGDPPSIARPQTSLTQTSTNSAVSSASSADDDITTLRTLEVDDVPMNRRIIKNLLKKVGVTDVVLADDGDVAVDMVKKHDGFDLICMDVSMPRMSGIDATKAIRAMEADGQVSRSTIIGITAHTDSGTSQGMLEAGMDGFHHKPVTPKMIGEVARRAAAMRRNKGQDSSGDVVEEGDGTAEGIRRRKGSS